jgi:isopentenyl-diphosphate delta-isomerase
LLVTQRAHVKKVWPDVWTNSACGHPAPDESFEDAIRRRSQYELGLAVTDIRCVLPRYIYKTPPYKGIVEHEFCPVFVAQAAAEPQPNPLEVEAYRWQAWPEFVSAAQADTADIYSWWCKDQLRLLLAQPLLAMYSRPA